MMYSAITSLDGLGPAQALAEAVEEFDSPPFAVGHFEIEDGSGRFEVGAHFEERPDEIALALLAAVHGAKPWAVSEVPDVDWVAKVRRDLPPVEAGRFFLYGAHDSDKVPPGRVALLIEAAMAFGTGHHGTTVGCLLAIDALESEGFRPGRIADVGAGTAVLAMGAARAWPGAEAIVAGDIDPVAVETARANLAANGLTGQGRRGGGRGAGRGRVPGRGALRPDRGEHPEGPADRVSAGNHGGHGARRTGDSVGHPHHPGRRGGGGLFRSWNQSDRPPGDWRVGNAGSG
jgi:hypothetical protein